MIVISSQERLACLHLGRSSSDKVGTAECMLASTEKTELLQWSIANELASSLALGLAQQHGWVNVPVEWRVQYEAVEQRVSAYMDELDHLAKLFLAENIRVVALKNAGIARGIIPYVGACPMGDIDILVLRSDFRAAHTVLMSQGYHFEFRSAFEEAELIGAERSGGTEYWKVLPNGDKMWLELQWRPVAGRWIRPDQEPSAEELMSRALAIPGTDVRLLAPEDNLLQVALHTAKHTYVRAPGFRLHLDVERIVSAYPELDWNLFVRQVKSLQVKTAVYFSLLIPHDLFGTPIPASVLAALRPPAWKESIIIRWLSQVGLFNPRERKFNTPGYILFNALLYDDLRGMLRGVFPERTWMCERYGFQSSLLLPYYHARRLFDLALRRVNT